MMAATKAETPPNICTGPEPAKSITPVPHSGSILKADRKPWVDQYECAATGYTNPTIKKEYNKYARICRRSAIVPATIAAMEN